MKLVTLFKKSWRNLKPSFPYLILSIFFIIILVFALFTLEYGFFILLVYLKIASKQVLIFNASIKILVYLAYLALSVVAQIIILNNFFDSSLRLGQNLRTLKTHFWQMLLLNIAISIIFVVVSSPLYASVLFFLLNNPLLAYFSTIIGYFLIIVAACFLLFSPFVLMDQKISWLESIKKSYKIAKNNMLEILINLLILAILVAILNFVSILLINLMFWYAILGSILVIFLIMFSFSYLYSMYQIYK
jgi:hypothetical protein